MKKIYRILIAVCCAALLSGCEKDDESAFSGTDNYITAFKLTLGENGFSAAISGDSLIVRTVEGRELAGAKATVTLSENAKIYPDPSGIDDWDNNHSFVVTSFSGQQRVYQYAIKKEKAEAVKKGNFNLTTQTEVDDFGTLGVEILDGSLTVGSPYSVEPTDVNDPIESLSPLGTLREVKGTITFYGLGVDGTCEMKNLHTVGSISLPGQHKARAMIFPELETVLGNISLSGVTNAMLLNAVYLPKLKMVAGDFIFEGMANISAFMIPELERVLGNISLGGNGGTDKLESLLFPKLEEVGGQLHLYQFTGKKIDLPLLKKCGGLAWEGGTGNNMETLILPKLEELMGESKLDNIGGIKLISFPVLTYLETFELSSLRVLEKIEMPKLTQVKTLSLSYLPKLSDLNCLNTLETISGTLRLESLTGLTEDFAIPASLTSFNELAVSNLPGLTELDLRGTGIKGVNVTSNSTTPFKLAADDVMEGSLTLNGLFELTGMKEVKGDVIVTVNNSNEAMELLPNTETVGGNFTLTYNYTTGSIDLPALSSVKGVCKIKVKAPFTAKVLKEVGKELIYDKGGADNGSVAEFSLPELVSVGSDFFIFTGHVVSCLPNKFPVAQGTPFEIKMPKLTTIGGILKIHTNEMAGTSTRPSNRLANLDGFGSLTRVKGVDIFRQAALRSYKGLENAINSFTADDWQLSQTGYMPAYQDLAVEGEYIDPTL